MKKLNRLTVCAMLAAAAVVLGWVEHVIPFTPSLPGIKIGLANIAVTAALYLLGKKEAASVALVKVLVTSLLFSGMSGFLYSFAGAALSLLVMILLYNTNQLSPVGVSAGGGFAHVAAQFAAAIILTSTPSVWRLAPLPLACGVLTGAANGYICGITVSRLTKKELLSS